MSTHKVKADPLNKLKGNKNQNALHMGKSVGGKTTKSRYSVSSPLRYGCRPGSTLNHDSAKASGSVARPKTAPPKKPYTEVKKIGINDGKKLQPLNPQNSVPKQMPTRPVTYSVSGRIGARPMTTSEFKARQKKRSSTQSSLTTDEKPKINTKSGATFSSFSHNDVLKKKFRALSPKDKANTAGNEIEIQNEADSMKTKNTQFCDITPNRFDYRLTGQTMTRSISYNTERGLNHETQQTTRLTQQFRIELNQNAIARVLTPSRSTDCLTSTNNSERKELVPFGNSDNLNYEDNPMQAGMRLFTTVVLKSWRDRRFVREALVKQLEEKRHNSMKAKNQVHMMQNLVQSDVQRIKDVKEKLNSIIIAIKTKDTEIELMKSTEAELKAKNLELEKQLLDKYQAKQQIDASADYVKENFKNVLESVGGLLEKIKCEQQNIDKLELHNTEMKETIQKAKEERDNQIRLLCYESAERKATLTKEQELLLARVVRMRVELDEFALRLNSKEIYLLLEIEKVYQECEEVRKELLNTVEARALLALSNPFLHDTVFKSLHWTAYMIAPIVPQPKASFLEKPVYKLFQYFKKSN